MDPEKIEALQRTMKTQRVTRRTRKALVEKVQDGLFDLEIKNDEAFCGRIISFMNSAMTD